ncbi:MAG: acetamidase/formamidase family protein [Acidobacteriota bacterium]|nr:acetamidase/formamidase family protein [Acidobacteriota bacterium]
MHLHKANIEDSDGKAMMTLALLLLCMPLIAQTHVLPATPENVVIGYYDASTPPVLRIHSGEAVEIHTLGVASPTALKNAGLPEDDIEPALLALLKAKPRGRGHFLTGPVFVEGAEPGDVLEVQIQAIRLAVDYAYNGMGLNGTLADEFPEGGHKIIRLDRKRMIAPFAPGVEVPLRPFFGSMGLAPAASAGRASSTPPGVHAGNLDNRELIAGTKLFIPVQAPGALFQVGDGHAAQGDGEVDQTGLETSLIGDFRFILHKNMRLKWPRAETPTHFIAMGIDADLNKAVKIAVDEAVDFLMTEPGRTYSRHGTPELSSGPCAFPVCALVPPSPSFSSRQSFQRRRYSIEAWKRERPASKAPSHFMPKTSIPVRRLAFMKRIW